MLKNMVSRSLTVLCIVAISGVSYGQANNGSTRFVSADDVNR